MRYMLLLSVAFFLLGSFPNWGLLAFLLGLVFGHLVIQTMITTRKASVLLRN